MKNLPNVRYEWSWVECNGVELKGYAQFECSGWEVVRKLEKCWVEVCSQSLFR